ncbi:hypothetical protein CDV36_016462 [Fusarium kuroshium]|uniref:Uncharacterized protein n=1 Tax=Fusarium kuroshium TaxID=2010991 RepID=A0A3M2QNH7_9HYPO|nr:hypothetical protein CDV36_016462 [Fusarium kuroshium]
MGNRFVYPDASCTRFTRRVWNMDIWKKKMIAMVILIPYARWTSATSRLERENNTSPPPNAPQPNLKLKPAARRRNLPKYPTHYSITID